MTWQYKEFECTSALNSAQKALSSAIISAQRPHLYSYALQEMNAAMRNLATAQWRLMQAKAAAEAERRKNG